MKKIRIATRASQLAMVQTKMVEQELISHFPDLEVEIISMTTEGDQKLDTSLAKIGGKGLFIKELEQALYENKADIAVHSLKDMPVTLPEGLKLTSFLQRANPFDAFVSTQIFHFNDLPQGATIGTSSLRRSSQLQYLRPDLKIKPLRGNVITRIKKLNEQQYDAIILAVAGLKRLNLEYHIKEVLPVTTLLPAVGQGVICIECREADEEIAKLCQTLNHQPTEICALTERAMNQTLGGGCHVPVAAFATLKEDEIYLSALVGAIDGKTLLKAKGHGKHPERLGEQVAKDLMAQGAIAILQEVNQKNDS